MKWVFFVVGQCSLFLTCGTPHFQNQYLRAKKFPRDEILLKKYSCNSHIGVYAVSLFINSFTYWCLPMLENRCWSQPHLSSRSALLFWLHLIHLIGEDGILILWSREWLSAWHLTLYWWDLYQFVSHTYSQCGVGPTFWMTTMLKKFSLKSGMRLKCAWYWPALLWKQLPSFSGFQLQYFLFMFHGSWWLAWVCSDWFSHSCTFFVMK